jgi:hypothetical protein
MLLHFLYASLIQRFQAELPDEKSVNPPLAAKTGYGEQPVVSVALRGGIARPYVRSAEHSNG